MEVTSNGIVNIENPFDFFELPFVVQEDYLLKADWNSIKNLCAAAALSKTPGAVDFFEGLCGGYMFWRRKLRQDFPRDYARILREDALAKGTKKAEVWRGGYGNLFRVVAPRMIAAARIGDLSGVTNSINLGADVNSKDGSGYTALMYASETGYDTVVQALLDAGADPNALTSDKWTALMMASSEGGHFNVVQSLLRGGADIDLQNEEGETALDIASERGYDEIVQLIKDKSEDLK